MISDVLMSGRTNELLSQSVPLPQVVLSQHEYVDDAHKRHHERHVIGGVKLVHDDAEAVLLLLHTLNKQEHNLSH